MINLNKIAIGLAAVALASLAGAQEIHNWRSSSGEVVKSGTGLCVRDSVWTPATAAPGCDGAIAPTPAPAVVAAPKAAPAPAPAAALSTGVA